MNVIRTTAAGTLEGSYGGIETQRTKPSSFYLPPRASSTRLRVGYHGRNQPITSQIDILFAFNNSSTPYQKPPVELLPAPRKAPKADPTNAVLNATHPYAIPQKRVYGAGFSLTIRLILLSYAARSFLKRL